MNQPINPFYSSKPRDQLLDVAAMIMAGWAANPAKNHLLNSAEDAIDIAETLIEKVDEACEEEAEND